MSIDLDIFKKAGINSETDEMARLAVKNFRALQPTLTAYARMLTKNKSISVEMAARDNGSTDSKKIFMRPPITLGEKVLHQRRLCDKRDEDKQLLCRACAIRESVLVTIYHEISHNAYDSFDKPTEVDKATALEAAIKEVSSAYAERVKARIEKAPYYTKESYIGMVGLINPFLPLIVNGLEDARVNAEMTKARKGTRVMFEADAQRIFTEGVQQGDNSIKQWRDYPQNMQVIVGLYCKASGYDYKSWFIAPVVKALDDTELTTLCNRVQTIRAVAGIYQLSFPVLARLRELGFCVNPADPEPEPEPEESEEQDDQPTDESGDTPPSSDDGEECDSGSPGSGSETKPANSESDEDGTPGGAGTSEPSDDTPEEGTNGGDDQSHEDDEADDDSNGESDEDSDSTEESSAEENDQKGGATSKDSDQHGDESSDSDAEKSSGKDSSDDTEGEVDEASTSNVSEDNGADADGQDSDDVGANKEISEEIDYDSGADDGTGGIELIEDEKYDHIPMGDPEDCAEGVHIWTHHEEFDKPKTVDEHDSEDAVDRAIVQGIYFETPSQSIYGVREHHYGDPLFVDGYSVSGGWQHKSLLKYGFNNRDLGLESDYTTPQKILGDALVRMRVTFADNARGHDQRNLKSGKVNARVLGKRAYHGDERIFKRRTLPGKKSYFVLLGMDISGSTVGQNIIIEKKAVMAQATLLSRMGIPFAIYAHSANYHAPGSGRSEGLDLDVYVIKEPHEPWEPKVQERLKQIGPDSANLDGHWLEYLRKIMDRVEATDKIILYYSDGKMPAENHDEELEILQREIKVCKKRGYTLLGVGIRTDSPVRHGLDTVQIDSEEDVVKVVRHLEKRLLQA